jgi:hypothetical protein
MTESKTMTICDAVLLEEARAERTYFQNRVLVLAQTCHNLDARINELEGYVADLELLRQESADREAMALGRAVTAEEALMAPRIDPAPIPTRALSVESLSWQDQLQKYGESQNPNEPEKDSQ